MRSSIFLCLVLGTWCFAQDDIEGGSVGFGGSGYQVDDVDLGLPDSGLEGIFADEWKEAEETFKKYILHQFANGTGHTRARRHTKSTEFSEKYDVLSNIYSIYSDNLETKHKITKRQAGPASCTNPSTGHCGNFFNSRFRTVDGTCNNVNNPVWGSVNRPFNRLLRNAYDDGSNAPRGGFTSRLPNPRLISVTVHPDSNVVNSRVTNMVPQFGQFLDHDLTLTPNSNSQCCANPNSNPADCWAINVANDQFYANNGQRCLDFVRSTPCIRSGVREQMNANTAFIDGSQIYGSAGNRAQSLRTMQGGLLRTNSNFRGFLPFASNLGVQVQGDFVAGDDRINEMPGLSVMHNVWLMEHNRIATAFGQITNWSDERIYQETRRIVIAELQQVTYNEYLPAILGAGAISEYDLGVGTWSTYNSQVDPSIVNEFATASYRFGHSMVPGLVQLFNAQDQSLGSYRIADEYFQSRQITRDNGQGYDMILRGLMRQNAPECDRFVTTGVTNFLFKAPNANFGSDLVARNIQRGRDHGLLSYNDYRVAAGGSDISTASWATPPPGIDAQGWAQASRVYRTPADIDLFVGGLIETPVNGGVMGQTFASLNAIQFSRLKFGDRYFFTHSQSTGFTSGQLNDLTRRRLSDIICENSQQPNAPANAFTVGSPLVACGAGSGRPTLNLNLYI